MQGTMLIFKPSTIEPEVHPFKRPPKLQELQRAVGGWLEAVPHFLAIKHAGREHRCVAFCNEDGKLERSSYSHSFVGPLPINMEATRRWQQLNPLGGDYLVGNIAVLFGDPEFMESL